nr:hypothetical protein [Tanacetum cinerariifolium]
MEFDRVLDQLRSSE